MSGPAVALLRTNGFSQHRPPKLEFEKCGLAGPRFRDLALLGRRHPPRITRYAVPGVRETCTRDDMQFKLTTLRSTVAHL
jgi:hypothetical protein